MSVPNAPVPLVLWDIDGTLVRVGPAGGAALTAAVEHALAGLGGADTELVVEDGYSMAGKTDPQIVRELLVLAGSAESDVDGQLAAAIVQAEVSMAGAVDRIAAEGRVLPGVREVLTALSGRAVQSVLTGNIRPNAAVKLGALGLDELLDLAVGAYGSDHHVRDELVPIALDRVAARYGRRWSPAQTWVVGDTPRDAACAAAGGARCLLVATGDFTVAELHATGADAVLPDLSDVDQTVRILTA